MYWRSGQYEALRGRDRNDRQRIVGEALKKYGRSTSRRFALVLVGLVATVFGIFSKTSSMTALSPWKVVAGAVLAGALFYVYLLWEINGPIRAAVEKYLAEGHRSS
ncbi:MAG TPA: hypothetical protein VMT03_09710 [Polyangia bacterium]|nr:hypothetical protein [Polyangia bacterium]